MSETWYVFRSGPGEPARNMAWDEALLEAVARLGRPILRFYGWTEPAATFGYGQHYRQVAGWTSLRPLIRRPTGGGLVPHDADWTSSLVFPPSHAWYHLPAPDSYRAVHQWIHAAFAAQGIRTELALRPEKQALGQCFIGAEKFDLLWRGAKVAGAAQRRNRHGLLVQGSVQPGGASLHRTAWEEAMLARVPGFDGAGWVSLQPEAQLRERVEQLAREKYTQAAYNERR
jgi:lipoate-protein ligase A